MEKRDLWNNISQDSINMMIPCFQPITKKYLEGETILSYSAEEVNKVGILIKGKAKLELFNADGECFLLETYESNDVFGELFALPLDTFQYIITAETDSFVMYVDYEHLVTPCEHLCDHHSQLLSNLFIMTAQKTQELALHISILSQPTIRGKLIAYLKFVKAQSPGNGPFTIPMSLGKLAEYLRVDRTAMMREIKAMKNDGIIDSNRREFELFID